MDIPVFVLAYPFADEKMGFANMYKIRGVILCYSTKILLTIEFF